MQTVPVTYQAPKELNDVRQCLVDLVADLKAKKPLLQIAATRLVELEAAVVGIDQIPLDFKTDPAKTSECAGHMGGQIVGALLS